MKTNLNKPFLDLFGNIIKNESGDPENIKDVICIGLFSRTFSDTITNYKAFKLCNKIWNSSSDEIELDKEEISLILESSKNLTAGGYGQIYNILNGFPQI